MKNTLSPGGTLTTTAPSGGIASGAGLLVGAIFGVAVTAAAVGETVVLALTGEYELPKATGVAVTQGQALYWDSSTGRLTPTYAAGLQLVAVATAAAGSSATTVTARLQPAVGAPAFDDGSIVTVPAPSGGVTAGQIRQIGDGLFGAIIDTAAAGVNTRVQTRGTHTLPKTSTETMSVGDILYWDGTVATATPSAGDLRVGVALQDRANPTSTVLALLVGVGEPLVVDTTE